ncbi:hypothetical protein K438DRAFT_1840450 [Mycena galopus ATCC 62051]|nr:hypothetical protein K438DRAFT_1840450 [Mycena galopus ATCC 62051]
MQPRWLYCPTRARTNRLPSRHANQNRPRVLQNESSQAGGDEMFVDDGPTFDGMEMDWMFLWCVSYYSARRASGSLWACRARRSVGVLEMGSSRATSPGYLTYPPIRCTASPLYSACIRLFP